MKFTTVASAIALAASVTAAPAAEPQEELDKRFLGCLSQSSATTIVNNDISILQDQPYQGQSVNQTFEQIIAPNYIEYSDSILSLEDVPLDNTPAATSGAQWFAEVTAHPETGIQTLDIVYNCNKIVWYWLFPNVGSGQYRVKGFNLLTITNIPLLGSGGQVSQADIEFNSIAWGLDTQQIYQYCPKS